MAPPHFHELSEGQLAELPDDELIEYVRTARAGGHEAAMSLAVGILAFGYYDTVRWRVGLKVPTQDVDEVAATALDSALTSAFDGESVGEFKGWLHRITARRIADYHRKREGKPDIVGLPTGTGDDDLWGEEPSVEFEGVAVDVERAVDEVMNALNDTHRQIVDLYVFEDLPADEVARRQGQSEDNVHQVASRFRKALRELLDDGDTADDR